MHEHNWERVAGYAGIAAVMAFVIPSVVGTDSIPKPSDPDSVYKTYLLAHQGAIMRQVWFESFAAVMVLWLASGIRSFIRRHDEGMASLGNLIFGLFVVAAALLGVSAALEGGLVYRVAGETSPATVRLVYDIVSFVGNISLGLTTMLAAAVIAVAALTAHAMSRAVGYVSAITAGVNLAISLTVFTSKGFFSLEGSFTYVELIVTMVWLLALSINLIRPAEATAPARAPMVSAT